MKAYVINLPRALERRKAMRQRLASTPLADAEFVDGVDGRALSQKQREELFDYTRFRNAFYPTPLPGEVGCALSHYNLWKRIAKSRQPALILEDDILIEGDVAPYIEWAEEWLETSKPRAILLPFSFSYRPASLINSPNQLKTVIPEQAYGAIFYAINPAGARLLSELGKPAYVADDWRYFSKKGLEIRCFLEHPIYVPAGNISTIGDRADYNLTAANVLRYLNQFYFSAFDRLMYKTIYNVFNLSTGRMKVVVRESLRVKKS